MLHKLSGALEEKLDGTILIENAGFTFRLSVSKSTLELLPAPPATASVFCHLYLREDGIELYGFATQAELDLFKLLISVSGVGPKTALGVLGTPIEQLRAAIVESRPEMLTRAPGIGAKTAQRIILELKQKVAAFESSSHIKQLESDMQIEEALRELGYVPSQIREALKNIPKDTTGTDARLREALKLLSKR